MPDPGLYELLQAMRRLSVDTATRLDEALSGGGGGGLGGGGGSRDPPSLVFDFNSNLDAYASSPAMDVYIRAGEYPTTHPMSDFNGKSAEGYGQIIGPDYAAPSNVGYMIEKPDTWPVQGPEGWFRGDQWFTDGGEWKTIGVDVRTYDVNARYFESNTIPHHAWFDVLSGNSGIASYITGGVTPGNTITLPNKANAEWVGKQCHIKKSFGFEPPLTSTPLTVASVSGNTVTFTTSHSVTMAWNPAAGQAPNLSFAPRTWKGFEYVLVRAGGGGDNYGHIVRQQVSYQPKIGELQHTFNAATAGQYGGSIDFGTTTLVTTAASSTSSASVSVSGTPPSSLIGKIALTRYWQGGFPVDRRQVVAVGPGTITFDSVPLIVMPAGSLIQIGPDGTYGTGWESQYNDQGADVAVIAQVDSFLRLNDRADGGGRVHIGTLIKTEGRPADAAHAVAGYWRRGLDTTGAALMDGSYLADPASASATSVSVKWPSGARKGHAIRVMNGPADTTAYVGTITAISGSIISITPGLNKAYAAGSLCDFLDGGAAVIMKKNQWINWDGSQSTTGRGADPLGIWGPLFGNQTGNIWSGASNDGSDYWETWNGDARIRLRTTALNVNVAIQGGDQVSAAKDLVSNGSEVNGAFQGCLVFGSGLGEYVAFNPSTGKFQFYVNDALVYSVPP